MLYSTEVTQVPASDLADTAGFNPAR
jgi:hypothetical protein